MKNTARHNLGILFLVASNGLTAIIDAVAKQLTAELHSVQIVWGYFLAIFLMLCAFVLARREPLRRVLATRRLALHLTRAAMVVLTIATLFLGLAYMPLADGIALSFTAPLFVTALSVPLLGERVGWHRWSAVVVGLAGVAVILRPGAGALHWAAFMPLISAVFFALFQILTRRLALGERTLTTLLYTGAGGLLWSSLAVAFVWRPLALPHLWVFSGIGALGVAAHVCMIKAFAAAQVSLLAPFNYVKLVWATLLGYLMFADVPGPHVVGGSAIVVASGLYVWLRERRR